MSRGGEYKLIGQDPCQTGTENQGFRMEMLENILLWSNLYEKTVIRRA